MTTAAGNSAIKRGLTIGGWPIVRREDTLLLICREWALKMVDEVILETHQLVKEFKGFVAVNAVDLKIRRGEIHALIGPNGAGKTTFFNLLTKFLIPTSGRVLFNGHDITHEKPAQVARRGIVRSFQISATFPHLTVLENVRIAL